MYSVFFFINVTRSFFLPTTIMVHNSVRIKLQRLWNVTVKPLPTDWNVGRKQEICSIVIALEHQGKLFKSNLETMELMLVNWLFNDDLKMQEGIWSNYSRTWKSNHGIVTLSWPSLSPNMNLIKNLWSLLKKKVTQRQPKTLEDLLNAITNEWNELPNELAYNFINSIERRIQSLIDSSSDYTNFWTN